MENKIIDLTAQDYQPRLFSLSGWLVLVAHIYKAGVRLRLALYRSGILKQHRLPCPVISIGNITAGGSGKTPMAIYVAQRLIAMGFKPVVISRGYKGRLKKGAAVVGDGTKVFLTGDAAGDEPHMMANLRQFPVVVGKDRFEAGKFALDHLDVDIVVLDDGFQHLGLSRDLDIVLVDYQRPFGNGRMLPAGRLRESFSMCKDRINCLVITRCPKDLDTGHPPCDFAFENSTIDLPCFMTRHLPYLAACKARQRDILVLKDCKALLFSGIAWNQYFYRSAKSLGVTVLAHLEFTDHHRYKKADFEMIQNKARDVGAEVILTTQKDWVKVKGAFDFQLDVGVLDICMEFLDPDGFDRFLIKEIEKK